MKRDKWFYRNVIMDYVPILLLEKVNVKNIYDWSDFLYSNDIYEQEDIYAYLDNKIKQIQFDKSKSEV